MAQSKSYKFKKGDAGEDLEALVYYKPDQSGGEKPIALFFHGGNFIVGSKEMLEASYAEKLLDLGFGAVVSPGYRLAPTISAYGGPVIDSLDAYRWAQTELPQLLAGEANVKLDGDRLVAYGQSSGASIALLMAQAPKPPRAILDLYGLKYFKDEKYTMPSQLPPTLEIPSEEFQDEVFKEVPPPVSAPLPMGPKGFDLSNPRSAWFIGKSSLGQVYSSIAPGADLDKINAANLFSASYPPTFFIHGTADFIAPIKFSERAYEELKAKGVETDIIRFEGGHHGFDAFKKPGSAEFEAVVKGFEFLRAHV